ncbi:MAG: phosphatidylglycerophosphatase A [Balneolaceae bacterium]
MKTIKFLLGTGFYSGLIPKAPGTAGSLFSVFIIFLIIQAQIYGLLLLFVILSSIISLWVAPYFEDEFGEDPGKMVIDEWAGQGLTFITISFSGSPRADILLLISGFLLFRFFDILKPLGINKLQNIKGGTGILADDLLAGLFALICLKTLIFVWPNLFGIV